MSRPTQSMTGWAASGVVATSIPPAQVVLGLQRFEDFPTEWANLFGAWIGYFEGFTPADGVLSNREWECPDDSAYDVQWSSSVDGLLVGTLHSIGLRSRVAAASIGYEPASGGTATLVFDPSTSTGRLRTDRSGWAIGVVATDPTTPTNEAGITVDADSGDVTLSSDYGDVVIPEDSVVSSEYRSIVSPVHAWAELTTSAGSSAPGSGVPDVVITGSGSAGVIGFFDLGPASLRTSGSPSDDTILTVFVQHSAVTGAGGGSLTFAAFILLADGTLSAVSGASGSVSAGDSAGSVAFSLTAPMATGTRLLVRVSGNGTLCETSVEVSGFTYSSTHIR